MPEAPPLDATVEPVVPPQAPPDLGFTVTLDAFTGPLDLLLYLVRKADVDITDIPIAVIADQFAAIVAATENVDLEQAGDFIVWAATLLEIKARAVVPPDDARSTSHDPEEILDPRADLVRRLLEYRTFKEASLLLAETERDFRGRCERRLRELIPDDGAAADALDLGEIDTWTLCHTWEDILQRINGMAPRTVVVDDLPMERRLQLVLDSIRSRGEGSLEELFAVEPVKLVRTSIVLALLEGARQRFIELRQDEQFGSIRFRLRSEDERIPPDGGKLDPEPLPRLRKALPLVTYQLVAGDDDSDDDDGPVLETEDHRFARELEEQTQVDSLLRMAADVDSAYVAWITSERPHLLEKVRPPDPEPLTAPDVASTVEPTALAAQQSVPALVPAPGVVSEPIEPEPAAATAPAPAPEPVILTVEPESGAIPETGTPVFAEGAVPAPEPVTAVPAVGEPPAVVEEQAAPAVVVIAGQPPAVEPEPPATVSAEPTVVEEPATTGSVVPSGVEAVGTESIVETLVVGHVDEEVVAESIPGSLVQAVAFATPDVVEASPAPEPELLPSDLPAALTTAKVPEVPDLVTEPESPTEPPAEQSTEVPEPTTGSQDTPPSNPVATIPEPVAMRPDMDDAVECAAEPVRAVRPESEQDAATADIPVESPPSEVLAVVSEVAPDPPTPLCESAPAQDLVVTGGLVLPTCGAEPTVAAESEMVAVVSEPDEPPSAVIAPHTTAPIPDHTTTARASDESGELEPSEQMPITQSLPARHQPVRTPIDLEAVPVEPAGALAAALAEEFAPSAEDAEPQDAARLTLPLIPINSDVLLAESPDDMLRLRHLKPLAAWLVLGNAIAWGAYAAWVYRPAEVLTLTAPASVAGDSDLLVTFNLPVWRESPDGVPRLRLEPEVVGAWSWLSATQARFAPAAPWPLGTVVRVLPVTGLATTDGFRADAESVATTSVSAPVPSEVRLLRTGFQPTWSVRFPHAVDPTVVVAALLVDGNPATLVNRPSNPDTVLVRAIASGPRARMQLNAPFDWQEVVPAAAQQAVAGAEARAGIDSGTILVRTERPADAALAASLRTDPPLAVTARVVAGGVELRGPFAPGMAYGVSAPGREELADPAAGLRPSRTTVTIPQPSAEVQLTSPGPGLIRIMAAGADRVRLRWRDPRLPGWLQTFPRRYETVLTHGAAEIDLSLIDLPEGGIDAMIDAVAGHRTVASAPVRLVTRYVGAARLTAPVPVVLPRP